VIVDVNYDANMNRIGGTHQFTASNDNLDLGKCYWWQYRSGYGLCVKDSDGIRPTSFAVDAPGWDCDSNDTMCNTDFDSSVTTILPRSGCGAGGMYGETVNINYVASDDRYFSRHLSTYFCITPQGSTPCYPNSLGYNGTYTQVMTSSGFYDVYYYSQDPALNLEIVKNITIEVDTSLPIFTWTRPSAACNLQTTQPNLLLEGIISSGAMYICANNTRTRAVVCQNMTNSNLFTLNVPITSTSLSANITVYAKDSACNYYVSTVSATCNNRTFPRLRINVSGYYV
jgi:hypothetical protein